MANLQFKQPKFTKNIVKHSMPSTIKQNQIWKNNSPCVRYYQDVQFPVPVPAATDKSNENDEEK